MYETSAALATARWPLTASGETGWLRELTADDGLTGFRPPGLPDAAWVLHSMYEHELGPTGMSYVAYQQAVLSSSSGRGSTAAGVIPGLDPGEVLGVDAGERPGPRWRRLRWAELARRTGDPLVPEGRLPGFDPFPSHRRAGGWPVGTKAPSEGRLDRADWDRLVEILVEHSPEGGETRCLAYYTPLVLGAEDFDNLCVRAGRLGDAKALYDHPEAEVSPSNLWARDRSWVLCTDYDLWATKVAGPPALVEALLGDTDIEAVRLPWAT
ncbi:hypothetical protein ACWGF3_17215 [Streptomyces xanthophaeus]|uniref:Uncharacterized protein n=1 Tax=Streptomyces xanthophaeus TaxID=67385 RepID=A0A919L9I8_9ACTN|nr:hypothetical protein [Streptomyces xanthophaeus]GHI83253.1 hypothetical protein Sxan_06170 [Streptomyces xanthophaeus]